MRILIPGGSGQLGTILARHLLAQNHEVTVLSRTPGQTPWPTLPWSSLSEQIESTDVVIHLSGKSVNCRYTEANKREIIESRVEPTLLIGRTIAAARNPPSVWMNASTSTFYRNSFDEPQDEFTGETGVSGPEAPMKWDFSLEVARRWEEAFYASTTPHTRKLALRTSMTMSPDPGGVFRVLSLLARTGLGGTQGSGRQWVSWIHDQDYCRAIDFLLADASLSGPVNFTSPEPLPNKQFLLDLRRAWGMPIGLPAAAWMLEIGTFFLRTETELILKSRRAVPSVLLNAGFQFSHPAWPDAARDLVARTRNL